MPLFRYLLSEAQSPVVPGTPLWVTALPTSRDAAGGAKASPVAGGEVAYGTYFSTLHSALAANHCAVLCEAIAVLSQAPIKPDAIESVEIQLLKHGHFYHPARVVVLVAGITHRLALNVALTPAGIALLPNETEALDALAHQEGLASVARVLARGRCTRTAGHEWRWFLTPWFEGFHEFHLTYLEGGRQAVTVWNGAPTPTLLSKAQAAALLEGAARILTTAFNPHTLAHIFPWHHAAGDFVVRLDNDGHPQVRLITVRDYQPLLPPQAKGDAEADDSLERLLYALLLLVIQAVLRLRVDRLDGVGEIVVHPVSVVGAICRGCIDGIGRMCRRWNLPEELSVAARDYLGSAPLDDLNQLNAAVYGGFAQGSEEREAFSLYLEEHVNALHTELQAIASARPPH